MFTVRRTAHVVVASVVVELALDFGAGAVAVLIAPYVGDWVYAVAGVIVVGSLPVLGLNIARVARREWRRHQGSDSRAAPFAAATDMRGRGTCTLEPRRLASRKAQRRPGPKAAPPRSAASEHLDPRR